jgi:hypothetical protein
MAFLDYFIKGGFIEKLEFTESSMQQLDFSKGIVQKSNFTRKMNFGFQNRTTVLEIETTD